MESYDDVKRSNLEQFGRYFRALLEQGILAAPAQFEAMFVSAAHTQAELEATLAAVKAVFPQL